LNVVAFYWQGDRWRNDGLEVEYINRLFRAVRRNLLRPHGSILFTNERLSGLEPGIEVRPFRMVFKQGVLPRLYMFSREAGLWGSQVLCLDLDVVVVGSLEDLASYSGLFCARSKFAPHKKHLLDGDIISFRACHKTESMFWQPAIIDPARVIRLTGGRERYWFRMVVGKTGGDRWDKVAPGQVVSYKRHVLPRGGVLPSGARVVSCHGKPRPHELTRLPWVKEHWR